MASNYTNYPLNINNTQPQSSQFFAQNQINQMQSLFPQPVGNIYNLSTANEINNVPAGNGISIGLCLAEGVMYIKSLQNGAPMLIGYKLGPLTGEIEPQSQNDQDPKINDRLSKIEDQLNKIKEKLGGKLEWQI